MGSGKTQNLAVTEFTFGKDHYHRYRDMAVWCQQKIGPGGWGPPQGNDVWGHEVMFGNSAFYFTNERDAVIFALHWL